MDLGLQSGVVRNIFCNSSNIGYKQHDSCYMYDVVYGQHFMGFNVFKCSVGVSFASAS